MVKNTQDFRHVIRKIIINFATEIIYYFYEEILRGKTPSVLPIVVWK